MELRAARAVRILESGAKQDEEGKVVGKRKVLEYAFERRNAPIFGVMWTDGLTYHEIRSQSMKAILELEKIYQY